MGLAILFFYGLRGAIFRGLFPTTNIISYLLSSVKVELMFGYFLYLISGCFLNLGSRGTNLLGCHQRSWELELRGAHAPPQPPNLLLYHKELRLVKCFSKKIFFFFFFFIYISPFIISYFGSVCQVFFRKFFKKIFQIFLDFDGEM